MSDQLISLIAITAMVLLCTLFWAVGIALVLWDVNRHDLPGREQLGWLALAALLPLVGAFAYLFSRWLDALFPQKIVPDAAIKKRVTALRRPPELDRRMPTIAAIDLSRDTANYKLNQREGVERRRMPSVYKLAVLHGPSAGREFVVDQLPTRIGRGSPVDIRLDEDLGVSRQHAEIYEQDGVLRIRDLKSAHGTYVNGFSIADKGLTPGDQIKLSLSVLLLKVTESE